MSAGDRTVTVTLRAAVGSYISDLQKASRATAEFNKGAEQQSQARADAFKGVGTGALVAGGVIAAGLGLAVKAFADFDAQLSQVRAVSGATAGQMKQLSDAALQAGADTVFSASDAAKAETELAKVGVSVSDILGGALVGSLNLAAAGGLDLADAATIAGQSMKIFKLEGSDVGHIADVLASGANKSAADVSTLGQALQQSGLQAAQTGLSLEDTVGTLALFSDNALNGSDAGTSFKTMLSRLNPTTVEASDTMKQLGLDFFDANGNFIGIQESAGLLQDKLKNLSVEQRQAALNTIFGSDAIRAATVLYDAGASGVAKYVSAVNDQGAAARVAAVNMDNLSGDVEQLRGSIETGLIKSGSVANGVLRDLAQAATSAVNGFNGLPAGVQATAIGIASVASGALLAGGAVLTLVPKIVAAQEAMKTLGITTSVVRGILGGPWGLAIAAGTVALGLFAAAQFDAKKETQDLTEALKASGGAIDDNVKKTVAQGLQARGAFEAAKALGISVETVTNAALGQTDAIAELTKAQGDFQNQTDQLLAQQGLSSHAFQVTGQQQIQFGKSAREVATANGDQAKGVAYLIDVTSQYGAIMNPTIEKQQELNAATGQAATETAGLSKEQYSSAQAATDMAKAVDDAKNAVQDYGSEVASARGANRDFQASLDDAARSLEDQRKGLADARLAQLGITDATKAQTASALAFADAQIKAGAGLDITTAAGRDNQAALDKIAESAKNAAVANYTNGASLADVTAKLVGKGGARDSFIATAEKMGATKAAANVLADQLGLTAGNVSQLTTNLDNVPPETKAKVVADTASANAAIDGSRRKLDALDGATATVTIAANAVAFNAALSFARKSASIEIQTKADGGYIAGPGTATSDSIPAALSNGEYVVKAAAVAKYGKTFFDSVNSMRFADGGFVSRSQSQASALTVAPSLAPVIGSLSVTTTDSAAAVAKAIDRRLGDTLAGAGLL